ncbi:hypothetical protein GCM10020367_46620 [Streptomyces sannanensis]|uniref:DUF3515 domain-containing protein n=1 Tax=Streptomyces sannanensis TaxID=285536 RepID=A0ABP6SG95_9ACTN
MTILRHRPNILPALVPAAALLLTATGCSATNTTARLTVPEPPGETAALCRSLDGKLPDTVGGLDRNDPRPESVLTAGWGDDPAIVLRCGIPRPERLSELTDGGNVNGVDWAVERLADGGWRATTTLRKAYVEVVADREHGADLGPLTDLAEPVKKAIPEGIASY